MDTIRIKRVVDGKEIEIELTEEEIRDAYLVWCNAEAEEELEVTFSDEFNPDKGTALGLSREDFNENKEELLEVYRGISNLYDNWSVYAGYAFQTVAKRVALRKIRDAKDPLADAWQNACDKEEMDRLWFNGDTIFDGMTEREYFANRELIANKYHEIVDAGEDWSYDSGSFVKSAVAEAIQELKDEGKI